MKRFLLLPLLISVVAATTTPTAWAQTATVRYAFAGNANDLSGNGRNGTLLGASSISTTSLVIGENTTGRLRIPESAVNGLTDFSVTAVVDITPLHTTATPPVHLNTVLSGARTGEDNAIQIAYRTQTGAWTVALGSAPFFTSQSFFIPGPERPVAGRKVHITYVRKTVAGVTTGTFYQDGVQKGSSIVLNAYSSAALNIDPNGLLIGQDQDVVDGGFEAGQSLKGSVAELTIFNGALTAAQAALAARATWTGDETTAWGTANNWSLLTVPTATTDPVVPSAPTNQPVISSTATARNLRLESGSLLNEQAGGSLDLKGNLTNNASGTLFNGLTTFSGASPQTLGGSVATAFHDLTIGTGSGLTDIGPGTSVSRVLQLNGSFTSGETPIVLRSTASGTALVVNNGGVVNGLALVQRYIAPGTVPGLGYRHMSSPVAASPFSDLNTSGFTAAPNPVYNSAPVPGSVLPYPNIFFFDESKSAVSFEKGYQSPASAGSLMVPGVGYSVHMPPTSGASTTPDFIGNLNDGPYNTETLTRTSAATLAGWHLVGNPYPAPIDWNIVRTTPGAIPAGMDDAVSVLKATGSRTGIYLTYNNGIGNLPGGLIPSAQGFFIHNSTVGGTPVFQFTNAMRATSYVNPTHFRATPDNRPLLTLALTNLAADVTDEAFVYAETGATLGFDSHFDAAKVGRSLDAAPTLAVVADGQQFAICGLAPEALRTAGGLDLPLHVLTNAPGTHELRAATLRTLPAGIALWLTDTQTGQVIDLRDPAARLVFAQSPTFEGARFWLRIGGSRPTPSAGASALLLDAYPNPAATGVALRLAISGVSRTAAAAEAVLLDGVGRAVRHATVRLAQGGAQHELPLAGLPAGAYILRVMVAATGEAVTRSIVVQ